MNVLLYEAIGTGNNGSPYTVTLQGPRMTKELAILIREDHPYLPTDDFMKAINVELRKRMAN